MSVTPPKPSEDAPPPASSNPGQPPPEETDPRIGRTVGKYYITRRIGKGGMGIVYEGEDTILHRFVAIKFLPEAHKQNQQAIERFVYEAQVAGGLNHPNIISIHDIGQDDGTYYIVMELLNPGSAGGYLGSNGPMHWTEATQVIAECCSALHAAHQVGLIHRDIKPDNILCSMTGSAKLVDFGLVKDMSVDAVGMTQTGMIAGTPQYMSPEQCSAKPLDSRSDLYSLGATYFALLTAAAPYKADSLPQLLLQHCVAPTPDPRSLVADVPERCMAVLERAMEKKPADRYQTAQEMGAALQELLQGVQRPPNKFLVASQNTRKSGRLKTAIPNAVAKLSGGFPSTIGPGPISSPKTAIQPLPRSKKLYVFGAAGVALCILGILGLRFANKSPAPKEPVKPVEAVVSAGNPIKVGILQSLSGTTAISTRALVDATQLAVDEINAQGGLLGRKIESLVVDGRSDNATYAREAERLIEQEKVSVIFGGFTASNRRALLPVVEKHRHLLVYPARHEGLEDSQFVLYTGVVPNQQVVPALRYFVNELGRKRLFLIGTDGLYAHVAHEVIQDLEKTLPAKIVGQEYVLVGNVDFKASIKKIKKAKPEVIFNFINGDSNVAFFRQLRADKITPEKIPTVSFSMTENELGYLKEVEMAGDYVAMSYSENIGRTQNQEFVKRFRKKYGEDRHVTDPMEAAYVGTHVWATAVRLAGTVEVKDVRKAMLNLTFEAPGETVRIDAQNNHAWKNFRLGKLGPDNEINIVSNSEKPLPPEPFPMTRTRVQWEALAEMLYKQWGNNWVNPQKPNLVKGMHSGKEK